MVQDSTTYYVWIGGSCDYGHKERPGGADVVLELMDQREQSQRDLYSAESRQKKTKSQHDGSIISRDVISDFFPTIVSISKFPKRLSSASIFCIKMAAARQKRVNLLFALTLHIFSKLTLNML